MLYSHAGCTFPAHQNQPPLHTWSALAGSYCSGTCCNQQQSPVLCKANACTTNLFLKKKKKSGFQHLKGFLLLAVKTPLRSSGGALPRLGSGYAAETAVPTWALQHRPTALLNHALSLEGSSAHPC